MNELEKRKFEEVEELPYSFRNITLNILLCFPDGAPALIVLIMRNIRRMAFPADVTNAI